MLLDTLGASLLGFISLLTGNWMKAEISGQGVIKLDEGAISTGQDFQCCLIIWLIQNTEI